MVIILACLLLISTFLGELAGAAAGPAERLPGLDDETMKATLGTSRYHSATMRMSIGAFHDAGDEWKAAKLGEYFLTGIFQHYVHELCSLDMTHDYESGAAAEAKALLEKVLDIDSDDIKLGCGIAGLLNKVAFGLKSNPTFVGLGICFHRNKVKQEKLETRLEELKRVIPEKHPRCTQIIQAQFDEIMSVDRKATDQQVAFYHWMKEVLEGSVGYIKTIFEESGALPAPDDKDLLAICSREPDFLTLPVYAELVPLALAEKP